MYGARYHLDGQRLVEMPRDIVQHRAIAEIRHNAAVGLHIDHSEKVGGGAQKLQEQLLVRTFASERGERSFVAVRKYVNVPHSLPSSGVGVKRVSGRADEADRLFMRKDRQYKLIHSVAAPTEAGLGIFIKMCRYHPLAGDTVLPASGVGFYQTAIGYAVDITLKFTHTHNVHKFVGGVH